jgi:hypothetical protein
VRRAHLLQPTTGRNRPSMVLFFDTETRQDKKPDGSVRHRLRLGYAVYCNTRRGQPLRVQSEQDFYSPDDFWDYVEQQVRPKTKLYIVAHNLNFDLPILHAFKQLAQRGWELQSFYAKAQTGIYRWKRKGCTLIALDNGNFFGGKLERWANIVGRPKPEVDFQTVSQVELLHRCREDTFIMVELWRVWLRFLDENDCGAFKPTVASTAFNTWRHRFLSAPVWVHIDPLALELERKSYKGGRVECLWVGRREDGPFYYLDVNSMYAFVMSVGTFPAGWLGSSAHGNLEQLRRKLEKYSMIAEVTLNVEDNLFPHSLDGFTTYPLGEFRTVLTTPELAMCLERGWVKSVGGMSWYRSAPLFHSYADYFYNTRLAYREAGQEPMADIAKLLINGLYGKFGQRGIKQERIGTCDPGKTGRETVYDTDKKSYYDLVYLGGQVFKEWLEGEAFHSLPAVAAHVTALARLHLSRLVRQVPAGHCFYMDTDSLIVDHEGAAALSLYMDPLQLGALKVERESPWLEVWAPKDYHMQGVRRLKGIRAGAELVGENTYRQEKWPKLLGMIRTAELEDYTVVPVEKHITRIVHSGEVGSQGWVSPFHLPRE